MTSADMLITKVVLPPENKIGAMLAGILICSVPHFHRCCPAMSTRLNPSVYMIEARILTVSE